MDGREIRPPRRVWYRGPVRRVLALWLLSYPAWGESFVKGPYLQNVSRTGITVMWQSDPALPGTVSIDGRVIEAPPATIHEVRVEGLQPGRRYAYKVDCGGKTSGGELTTAPVHEVAAEQQHRFVSLLALAEVDLLERDVVAPVAL